MKQSITGVLALSFLFPGLALAHTGVGEPAGFLHGVSHPIGGADHLLAMVAVGLWAAQMGGRALWAVPCAFVGIMVPAGVFGFSGVSVPFIEEGITVSVLVLGLLIAGAFRLSPLYGATLVGFFAVFHGNAHGAEMPAAIGAAFYTVGFALATATLHAAGMALGVLLQRTDLHMVNRFAGGAVALGGIYLAAA